MFLRKNWYWLLTLFVVIGILGFIILKPKAPVTETKIFKVPDANQVRKNISDNRAKRTTEQGVKEKTETPVVESTVSNEEFTETPTESPTDGIPLGDEEVVSTETETEDWRAKDYGESPYGYGPYPGIPSDYPEVHRPIWTFDIDRDGHHDRLQNMELLNRVRIKLWKQGRTDVTGIDWNGATDKVYILNQKTVYVRNRKGMVGKKIHVVVADSNLPQDIITRIEAGEKPSGYRILNYDSGGFDIYQFLE